MTLSSDLDISQLVFWGLPQAERMAVFRRLRQLDEPVFLTEQAVPFIKGGPGYYALVRHADVTEASRNAVVFSSEPVPTACPTCRAGWPSSSAR